MAREDYEVVIGLEVHAELSTKTKIFCSCPTEFGAKPNTHTCPICMAMPGALPVLNEKVVEYAVKAGLATNCQISRDSKNDRKNYFYPDTPKSYQISQFDKPLCEKGYVEIENENGERKKVGVTRIHIEEDAGKLNHSELSGDSLVDLNRAGVPLIEIVSEPDFRSAEVTFGLLSQVSGRAGRSDLAGEVVIQSYNPEHYSIVYAKEHDYYSFYKEEMSVRKTLSYPPYYYITLINITSRDYDLGFKEANKIGEFLRKNLSVDTKVLGPSMASVFRINNIYHYQCIIKYKRDDKLNKVLTHIDNIYKINNKVDVSIDVDPIRV